MAEITEGSAFYKIGADISDLDKGVKESLNKFNQLSKGAEQAGNKMDAAFSGNNIKSFQSVLESLTGTIDKNEKYLAELINEQNAHAATLKKGEQVTASYLAKEAQLANEIQYVTKVLQLQRSEQTAGIGSTSALESRVKLLTLSYSQLSVAEQKSAIGQTLRNEIAVANTALNTAKKGMNETATAATSMGGAVSKGASAAWGALRKLAYIIPGLGIAGIISAIVAGITELIKVSGVFKKQLSELEKAQKLSNEVSAKAIDGYVEQKVQMENLIDMVNKEGKSYAERQVILKTYNKEFGEVIGKANTYAEAESYIIKQGANFIKAIELRAKALAALSLSADEAKKQIELQLDPEKSLTGIEKAAYKTAKFLRDVAGENSQMKKDFTAQVEIFEKKISQSQKQQTSESIERQNKINEVYKTTSIEAEKLGFKFDETGKKAKDFSSRVYNDTKDLADLLKEISDSKDKYNIQFGPDNENEQLKINKYFDELTKKIDDFNKDPKRKVKLTDAQIKQAKEEIEENRVYAQSLADSKEAGDNLKKQLEEQKNLYKEYEDFKAKYGEQAANDLYGDLTAKYKTYLERVQAEYDKLWNKGSLNSAESKTLLWLTDELSKGRLFEAESARKVAMQRVENEERAYDEIIKKAKDYYIQVTNLNKKYEDAKTALRRKDLSKNEYDKELKAIDDYYKKELNKIDVQNSDFYKALNLNFQEATKKNIKDSINIIDEALSTGKWKNKRTGEILDIPPDVLNRLREYRGQLENILSFSSPLQETARALAEVGQAFSSIGSGISQIDGGSGLGDMVSTIGDMLQTVSVVMQNFSKAMDELKGAFKGLSGWKFDLSNIISIIISAITFIVRLFSNVKRYKDQLAQMQSELADKNAQIEVAEFQINEELRKQNLLKAEGIELTNQELDARKKVLEANKQQAASEYDRLLKMLQAESYVDRRWLEGRTWIAQVFGGKPKERTEYASLGGMNYDQINKLFLEGRLEGRALSLFQQLQKLKEEGVDIDQQLVELQRQANEILTATTSSAITDSIVDGFRNGKTAIEDFTTNFEDLMREAMLNSLKYKYLEEPIQEFYKQFSDDAASGNVLTKDEIEQLRLSYKQIWDNANAQFENLKDVTGIGFDKEDSKSTGGNTLSKGIKAITQDQADILGSTTKGMQVSLLQVVADNKKLVEIGNQKLNYLQKIEVNTYKTATAVISLDQKIKNIDDIKRAAGIA